MLKQISLLLAITILLETLVIYMEWAVVPIEKLPNSYYKLRERLDGRSDSSPRIQSVTNRRLVPCISTTIAVGLCLLWSAFCLSVFLTPPSPPLPSHIVCVAKDSWLTGTKCWQYRGAPCQFIPFFINKKRTTIKITTLELVYKNAVAMFL